MSPSPPALRQHFFTHARYPSSGLGAHTYCRNPGGVNPGPWCYTAEPRTRWERCDVPPPSLVGCSERKQHHTPANPRGPSVCERTCPQIHALISGGDCEADDACGRCEGAGCRLLLLGTAMGAAADANGLADVPVARAGRRGAEGDGASTEGVSSPGVSEGGAHTTGAEGVCSAERRACQARRDASERLQLVLWLSLAGTSLFVLSLLWYAYRLTSPLGSPRTWAAAGYHGLPFASPTTAALPGVLALDEPSPKQERWNAEQELRDLRAKELLDAEHAVLIE